MKLLLVEDDANMRRALELMLNHPGILIEACGDGLVTLEKWRAVSFGQAVEKEKLFDIVFPDQADMHDETIEVVLYRLLKKLQSCAVTLMNLCGLSYLIKAKP